MNRSSLGSHQPGSSGADIAYRIKYQNNLPDIPFDPKSIKYPFDVLVYNVQDGRVSARLEDRST